MPVALVVALSLTLCACAATQSAATQSAASQSSAAQSSVGLVIRGQKDRVFSNLKIATASGSCVVIENSTNITIRNSQIGPCGQSDGQKHGIAVLASSGVRIYDSYIHPEHRAQHCCDTGNGVFVKGSSDVLVQGNVIAYGESNVQAIEARGLRVIGNYLLNPQGPFPRGLQVQAWLSHDILVEGNYTFASTDREKFTMPEHQEDALNFGNGAGFIARGNYLRGGESSVSGCGIMADEGADDALFQDNTLLDVGTCGIGIASGQRQAVRGNRVLLRKPMEKAGNTAVYVWNQYKKPCGPVEFKNNVATMLRADGTQSGYWDGRGCGTVVTAGNTWDEAARRKLTPPEKKLPPPPIPPRPFACAAVSPYTNQTKVATCK